jgi:hypothetical protein
MEECRLYIALVRIVNTQTLSFMLNTLNWRSETSSLGFGKESAYKKRFPLSEMHAIAIGLTENSC